MELGVGKARRSTFCWQTKGLTSATVYTRAYKTSIAKFEEFPEMTMAVPSREFHSIFGW